MNFFEIVCLGLIFILFPLYIYLFYVIYNIDIGKKDNNLLLDFALCTSFYLCIRYGVVLADGQIIFLFNTVLLLAYLKKRTWVSIGLSIFTVIYYAVYAHFSIIGLCVQYILYFLLYILYDKERLKNRGFSLWFIVLQIISIFYYLCLLNPSVTIEESLPSILVMAIVFSITCYCSKFLFESGESMIMYHRNVKKMKEEKNFRDSLFKVTHEVKNPIAVCKGYLDMFDTDNLEHSKKYIPIIKQEIARTLLLLEDFLSMNKIKIEKDILDINLLLEEISNHFSLLLKEKNIEGQFRIEDEEVYVMGDYNRIVQVFINLVKNSIEALDESINGSVFLYTKRVGKKIHIFIEDNGCGISTKDLKRIKEPFYTTKRRGTGLGVSLSNEIIEAHDGKMEYMSEEGNGTKVIITLPILEEFN